mmetsp:Transcript_9939/g.9667  ORF Transcript_9939/g.9667 Transcript_9939/m.9667 type:complete len:245 (-) Transcript_9939:271-1005(-)
MAIFLASVFLLVLVTLCSLSAFQIKSSRSVFSQIVGRPVNRGFPALHSTEEVEDEADSMNEQISIPTYLPSERGVDYVPFAIMLSVGDFEGADQFARDNLIRISGPGSIKRNFVYWTEVKNLPMTDLCTMERLWLQFSDGNFGYSVQKRVWEVEQGNFDNYIRRIGWTIKEEDKDERKKKWFGTSEFTYTVEGAPKGHLPLTSALRGTQLMKELMAHPAWTKYDWKNYKTLEWSVMKTLQDGGV